MRGTLPDCCPSAASGAARRPPAIVAMKARRGISGEQMESTGSILTVWPGFYQCRRAWGSASVRALAGLSSRHGPAAHLARRAEPPGAESEGCGHRVEGIPVPDTDGRRRLIVVEVEADETLRGREVLSGPS